MSLNLFWILLGLALLLLAFYLISRCVKYAHSLPEEDIGPAVVEPRTSRNSFPASLLYEESFLDKVNRLQCPLTDGELHLLGINFVNSKLNSMFNVPFESYVKKARLAT
jgi:hypothetical protein